jgi:hypothetical protein
MIGEEVLRTQLGVFIIGFRKYLEDPVVGVHVAG